VASRATRTCEHLLLRLIAATSVLVKSARARLLPFRFFALESRRYYGGFWRFNCLLETVYQVRLKSGHDLFTICFRWPLLFR
jgi:hypothetical protein